MLGLVFHSNTCIWRLAYMALAMLFASITSIPHEAKAGEDNDAELYIQGLADFAVDILGDDSIAFETRKQAFWDLVVANTDIEGIGYFTLGRYRHLATDQELQEFLVLLEQFATNFYETRMVDYSGERLTITGSVVRGPHDVIVTSQLSLESDPYLIRVNWRLVRNGDQYAIRDLEVLGIWLSIVLRSQFTSVIANNEEQFSSLLTQLRQNAQAGEELGAKGTTFSNTPDP